MKMGDVDDAKAGLDAPAVVQVVSATDTVPQDVDVLRLFAEEVAVTRETTESGRVRIAKVTHTREQPIDELLSRETVAVETVPVGRQVDVIPAVTDDGETMIIPIVEEILVVERRLILKEELHVRRVRKTERHRETVTLRYQQAEVTRLPARAPTASTGAVTGEEPQSTEEETQ